MRRSYVATIHAAALEVCCPHDGCGATQPSPDTGSEMWTADEVFQEAARHILEKVKPKCVACDQPYRLVPQQKAIV